MRQALIVLAALLLTACNAVVSTKPLFSDRDARGAPPLKPGVWAMLENANCAFDPADPPAQWPECADPVVFDGRVLRGPEGDKLPMAYLLAKGEPRILQLEMRDQDEPTNPETMYLYLAVEPEPGRGPVTRAKAWLVQCGPPSAAGSGGQGQGLTEQPLPGLEIIDKTCFADRASEVRNAARESRQWDDHILLRWVGPAPKPKP